MTHQKGTFDFQCIGVQLSVENGALNVDISTDFRPSQVHSLVAGLGPPSKVASKILIEPSILALDSDTVCLNSESLNSDHCLPCKCSALMGTCRARCREADDAIGLYCVQVNSVLNSTSHNEKWAVQFRVFEIDIALDPSAHKTDAGIRHLLAPRSARQHVDQE